MTPPTVIKTVTYSIKTLSVWYLYFYQSLKICVFVINFIDMMKLFSMMVHPRSAISPIVTTYGNLTLFHSNLNFYSLIILLSLYVKNADVERNYQHCFTYHWLLNSVLWWRGVSVGGFVDCCMCEITMRCWGSYNGGGDGADGMLYMGRLFVSMLFTLLLQRPKWRNV